MKASNSFRLHLLLASPGFGKTWQAKKLLAEMLEGRVSRKQGLLSAPWLLMFDPHHEIKSVGGIKPQDFNGRYLDHPVLRFDSVYDLFKACWKGKLDEETFIFIDEMLLVEKSEHEIIRKAAISRRHWNLQIVCCSQRANWIEQTFLACVSDLYVGRLALEADIKKLENLITQGEAQTIPTLRVGQFLKKRIQK